MQHGSEQVKYHVNKLIPYVYFIACIFAVFFSVSCLSTSERPISPKVSYANIDALKDTVVYLPHDFNKDWNGSRLLKNGHDHPVPGAENIPLIDPKLTGSGDIFFKAISDKSYISQIMLISNGHIRNVTDYEHGDVYRYAINQQGSLVAFASFNSDSDRYQQSFFVGRAGVGSFLFQRLGPTGLPSLGIDGTDVEVQLSPGGTIGIVGGGELYLVPGPDYTKVSKVAHPSKIRHLMMGETRAVFSAQSSGVDQIFECDYRDHSVRQLTYTSSNKIHPFIHGSGILYLDTGVGGAIPYDIRLLEQIHGGLNRRFFSNEWGRLSWSEAGNLTRLLNGYRQTGDNFYLMECIHLVDAMMLNTDYRRNIHDYRGRINKNWSTTRYSFDRKTPYISMIDTAQIAIPIAELILVLKDRKHIIPESEWTGRVQEWINLLEEIPTYFNEDYRSFGQDPWGVTQEGEGYFVIPKGSPSEVDGANVPFNYQNGYGSFLLKMHKITGRLEFVEQAQALGRTFKRHLLWIPEENAYQWNYWWAKGEDGWKAEEQISINLPTYPGYKSYASYGYASIDVQFVANLAGSTVGDMFTNMELIRLFNTNLNSSLMKFEDTDLRVELLRRRLLPDVPIPPRATSTLVRLDGDNIIELKKGVSWYKPLGDKHIICIMRGYNKPFNLIDYFID